jgi:hypothetical protein
MPSLTANITRELYMPAPDGIAVYAQNPAYASATGSRIVETMKHEAVLFNEGGHRTYYHPRIFRRVSDDNGRTWREQPDFYNEDPRTPNTTHRHVPIHLLHPQRDVLLSFHGTFETDLTQSMFARGNRRQRTCRMWWQISRDRGDTWSEPTQIIDSRPGHEATHWAPGITFEENGAISDLATPRVLDDGSIVLGLTALNVKREGEADVEGGHGVRFAHGWFEGDTLQWRIGDLLSVSPAQSSRGLCEPTVTSLGGHRLFCAMRSQGDEARGIFSTRFTAVSDDAGMTWSAPEPLRYDTGDIVWTPASLSAFVTSSRTGETYWLANILPGPVHGQMPRYPLCIARFDRERRCIVKDSVRLIQDREPRLPEQVRYTNWGVYEERGSGDLMLTLPEQPKLMNFTDMTRPEDFTADCFRYRLELA